MRSIISSCHLQLAQDAKAKEALDLALKIENDLIARKHDSGLRRGLSVWLPWKPAGRWTPRLGNGGELAVAAEPYPYAEAGPIFARAVGLARGGQPEQAAPRSSALLSCRKRSPTRRTSIGRDRSPSSSTSRVPGSSGRSAAMPRHWH